MGDVLSVHSKWKSLFFFKSFTERLKRLTVQYTLYHFCGRLCLQLNSFRDKVVKFYHDSVVFVYLLEVLGNFPSFNAVFSQWEVYVTWRGNKRRRITITENNALESRWRWISLTKSFTPGTTGSLRVLGISSRYSGLIKVFLWFYDNRQKWHNFKLDYHFSVESCLLASPSFDVNHLWQETVLCVRHFPSFIEENSYMNRPSLPSENIRFSKPSGPALLVNSGPQVLVGSVVSL